jgi:hypothetical protein
VDQARAAAGLILACNVIPSWDFSSKIYLAFHQSSVGRDSVSIPCPYVQDPKDEGEKAARYRQQEHILLSNSSICIRVTSRFPLATLVFARRRAAAGLRASPFVMSEGKCLMRCRKVNAFKEEVMVA